MFYCDDATKRGKYDRPQKNEARRLMFAELGPKTSILTLPSDAALCSQLLSENGVIDRATPQQWVEHDGSLANQLPKLAARLGFEHVSVAEQSLETYCPVQPIDLLNADMESSFTVNLGLAFESRLSNCLLDNATVILWITGWARNPATVDFHNWFEARCREPGSLRKYADHTVGKLGHGDPSVVLPIILFTCAMKSFRFRFRVSKDYRDRNANMIAIRFDEIYRDKSYDMPSFQELAEQFHTSHHREYHMVGHRHDLLTRLQAHYAKGGMSVEYADGCWLVMDRMGNRLSSSDHIEHLFETCRPFMSSY